MDKLITNKKLITYKMMCESWCSLARTQLGRLIRD